jgi:hypothetical protein
MLAVGIAVVCVFCCLCKLLALTETCTVNCCVALLLSLMRSLYIEIMGSRSNAVLTADNVVLCCAYQVR